MVCDIDWISKLQSWNYPRPYDLAPSLERLNLIACNYPEPVYLGEKLKQIQMSNPNVALQEWWQPIVDFLTWLAGVLWSFLAPYAGDIVLIILGGVASWFLPGFYKAIGVAFVAYALIDVYWKVTGGGTGPGNGMPEIVSMEAF